MSVCDRNLTGIKDRPLLIKTIHNTLTKDECTGNRQSYVCRVTRPVEAMYKRSYPRGVHRNRQSEAANTLTLGQSSKLKPRTRSNHS